MKQTALTIQQIWLLMDSFDAVTKWCDIGHPTNPSFQHPAQSLDGLVLAPIPFKRYQIMSGYGIDLNIILFEKGGCIQVLIIWFQWSKFQEVL